MNADALHKQLRIVARAHAATFPDPLILGAGQRVQVGRADEQWPAFLWCTDAQGKGGWVPETFLERQGDTAIALRAYDARELSVKVGDRVSAGEHAGGWTWVTDATGESGWIPEECISDIERQERSQ